MAKSTALVAVLALTAALAGCGQAPVASPYAKSAGMRVAAQSGNLSTIKQEIKDAIEDAGTSSWYEVKKLDVKPTERRGVFAFTAIANRINDGDAIPVKITGTYDAKSQEIDSEEEEL